MKKFTVEYFLTAEQVESLQNLKKKLDDAETLHSDSIEDLFNFMMCWCCAADIEKRISLLSEMSDHTRGGELEVRA